MQDILCSLQKKLLAPLHVTLRKQLLRHKMGKVLKVKISSILQDGFNPRYRVPDATLELLREQAFGFTKLAYVAELTSAVLRTRVIEVVIEFARLPLADHFADCADGLGVPAVNLPRGTIGDCL